MDARLEAVTAQHHGFFTRADAIDCGWNDRELAAACRGGVIRRLGQGIYSPAEIYDAADAEGQHVILAMAVLARQRGEVALTGPSAAALHGLCLYGQDLSVVHVVRLDGGSARQEVGVRHHVVRDDVIAHLEYKDGVALTNVARTVWETAGLASLEAGVVMADSALRLYPRLSEGLWELRRVFWSRPGSRGARHALALANGKSQSAGESISRVLFFRHAVPAPELQHEVFDANGELIGICDFYWDEDRHVGEFDGKAKYSRYLREGETSGDAVFREKRREDGVRGELLGMSRWTWRDLMPAHSGALIRRLNSDRARSRQLYTRNRTVIA